MAVGSYNWSLGNFDNTVILLVKSSVVLDREGSIKIFISAFTCSDNYGSDLIQSAAIWKLTKYCKNPSSEIKIVSKQNLLIMTQQHRKVNYRGIRSSVCRSVYYLLSFDLLLPIGESKDSCCIFRLLGKFLKMEETESVFSIKVRH